MAKDLIFPKTIIWVYEDQGHRDYILKTLKHEFDDILPLLNDLLLGI